MTIRTFTVALMLSALLVALPTEAWCNKSRQPGGDEQGDNFEVPEIVPTAEPFSFDNPDPRRRLRKIEPTFDPTAQTSILVVLGTDLDSQQVTDAQQGVLGMLMKSFCHPADVMEVFSGLRRVATFRNHPRVTDCGETWAKFRIQKNADAIGKFNRFIQEQKSASGSGAARLDLPHVIHHIGQAFHSHPEGNRVLVIYSSAVELSAEAPYLRTSYPTIGVLKSELSPYSTRGKGTYLGNIDTHFIFLNRFTQRAHRDGIQNFLSGFFSSQNSPLLTFSSDPEISNRVRQEGLPVIEAFVDDLNPGYVSVQPARILGQGGGLPSSLERGAVVVGLKWEPRSVDLDLHVSLVGKSERLSFRAPQTSFGTLQKQFETGWEEAYLTTEAGPQGLDLVVSFYGGTAPPEGVQAELQLSYAGTLYKQQLVFRGQGNGGQIGSQEHWQRIDIPALLQQQTP